LVPAPEKLIGRALVLNNEQILMRTCYSLLCNKRHRTTIVPARMRANGNFNDASLKWLHLISVSTMCEEPERCCWTRVTPSVCIHVFLELDKPLATFLKFYVHQTFFKCEIVTDFKVTWHAN